MADGGTGAGFSSLNPMMAPRSVAVIGASDDPTRIGGRPLSYMIARGFATAATLLFLVLILFVIARKLGGQEAGQLTPRQARQRTVRSRRDMRRVEANHAAITEQLAELRTPPSTPARTHQEK